VTLAYNSRDSCFPNCCVSLAIKRGCPSTPPRRRIIATVVAWISARSARRLAAENARREYLLKALSPLLEFADSRLERIGKVCTAMTDKDWPRAEAALQEIQREQLALRSIAFLSILEQSYSLKKAASDFFGWNATVLTSLSRMVQDKTATMTGNMEGWQIMVAEHMVAAIGQLRVATERFIFKGPTWADWWYIRSQQVKRLAQRNPNKPVKLRPRERA
jgi:hypothetical protein